MSLTAQVLTPPPDPLLVPPLESGDGLGQAEFHRRYAAMPHVKKAELIEGIVFMGSPVTLLHARAHKDIVTWLGLYEAQSSGVQAGDNATVLLDNQNEPQPDAFLRLLEPRGGNSRISADGYLAGAPELVIEIAVSSASIDLRDKFNAYRRNRVLEYIVWQVLDRKINWWRWNAGEFEVIPAGADNIPRSGIFPGLWLDAGALLRGDMSQVLDILTRGLRSEEHQRFNA